MQSYSQSKGRSRAKAMAHQGSGIIPRSKGLAQLSKNGLLLQRMQEMADASDQVQRLGALQTKADVAVGQRMWTGGPVLQRAVNLVLETKEQDGGRAKKVAGKVSGKTLPEAANPPKQDPYGWDILKQSGHTKGSRGQNASAYKAVRMHLFNGRLGGKGQSWNLAPGPASINTLMSKNFEEYAQYLVNKGHTVRLQTEVNYAAAINSGGGWREIVPDRIECKYQSLSDQDEKHSWSADIQMPELVVDDQVNQDAITAANFKSNEDLDTVAQLLGDKSNSLRHIYLFKRLTPELRLEVLKTDLEYYWANLSAYEKSEYLKAHSGLAQYLLGIFKHISQQCDYVYAPLIEFDGDEFDSLIKDLSHQRVLEIFKWLAKSLNPDVMSECAVEKMMLAAGTASDYGTFKAYFGLLIEFGESEIQTADYMEMVHFVDEHVKSQRQKERVLKEMDEKVSFRLLEYYHDMKN